MGGGIRTPEACADLIEAGASFVVIGTQFEQTPYEGLTLLKEMTHATHPLESVDL